LIHSGQNAADSVRTSWQAALPQGIVPFVFAKEYDLHAAILCTGYISQCKQIILVASS